MSSSIAPLSRENSTNHPLYALLAYLLTNASFYFLSNKAAEPTLANYFAHAKIWYAAFVSRPMIYLIVAALVHFAVVQAARVRLALR